MKNKKASLMFEMIMHLILIGIVFGLFYAASVARINSRGVKQQVLEKQTALLIDSAEPGMSFEIRKTNFYGNVDNVEVKEGKIFIYPEGLKLSKGYRYFTKYRVGVDSDNENFYIRIK